MVIKKGAAHYILKACNILFMLAVGAACVAPMLHVIMSSFSDPVQAALTRGLVLWPKGEPGVKAYEIILQYQGIWTGYANTLLYVAAQCLITGTVSVVGGYILSRKGFRYRNVFAFIMVFTMLFNGGMIPTYMVVRSLGILDSYAALLLPGAVSVFYMIMMRVSIASIPGSLEESVRIDGGGELTVLWNIVLPLCRATIAVVILFVAVAKWNEWFSALLYLPTDKSKYPLQMILREILITKTQNVTSSASAVENSQLYRDLVKYACIVVSTLPVLMLYPFVQKYFVKGVMIGSVKG